MAQRRVNRTLSCSYDTKTSLKLHATYSFDFAVHTTAHHAEQRMQCGLQRLRQERKSLFPLLCKITVAIIIDFVFTMACADIHIIHTITQHGCSACSAAARRTSEAPVADEAPCSTATWTYSNRTNSSQFHVGPSIQVAEPATRLASHLLNVPAPRIAVRSANGCCYDVMAACSEPV